MKSVFLLFIIPLTLFASQILSYNIYDRTDRADVMLTFDTPYHGMIKKAVGKHKIVIKLEDATIESPKIKNINSQFLKTLTITPLQDKTQIVAFVPKNIKLVVSKTADSYGLRLRFINKNATTQKTTQTQTKSPFSALPTKKNEDIATSSYYIVMAILFIGILILFFLKKKMLPQKTKKIENGWLFQPTNTPVDVEKKEPQNSVPSTHEVKIRFQKAIDNANSVVMIDFGIQSYLVLVGNGNILLDKFIEDKPATQEEFETLLQSRHEELEEFLQTSPQPSSLKQQTTMNHEAQEALNIYKEKASASTIYDNI